LAHNRQVIAGWLLEADLQIRAGMSSGNGGIGGKPPAGPAQARKPREHLASSFVTDHERHKVPAISFEESPGSGNAADPSGPELANGGSLLSDPAGRDNWKQAALLLACVAKMLTPDSARSKTGHSSRADLIRKLEELELRLHDCGDSGFQPPDDASPGLETKPSVWHGAPAATDSPAQRGQDARAPLDLDGGEKQPATFSGEDGHGRQMGNACNGDIAASGYADAPPDGAPEPFARELYRSLTPAEASPAFGGFSHSSTFPSQGEDCGSQHMLLQQIEAAHTRLAEQLQTGFAAAATEIGALRTAVSSAIDKIAFTPGVDQSQPAPTWPEQPSAALVKRLDLAASGFESLTAIQNSISELFVQLEELRRAVTVISMPDEQAPQRLSPSDKTERVILDGIAKLRALHEDTANRALLAWTSVQTSLEQVTGLCARLEVAATQERVERPSAGIDPNDPFVPLLAHLAQQGKNGAPQLSGTEGPRTGADESAQDDAPHSLGDVDASGFLIEPGHGFPGLNENREPQKTGNPQPTIFLEREDSPSRTDFIAAARRAARTARLEAQGKAPVADAGETSGGKMLPSLLRRCKRLFSTCRRAIVLATAILLAAIVTIAVIRLPILNKVSDFLPTFLGQFYSTGARAEKPPALDSVSKTAVIQTLPPAMFAELPSADGRSRLGPPQSASAATNTRVAALRPDPLAPPGGWASAAGAGDRASPASRAISGSDAIVAAAMLPSKEIAAQASGHDPLGTPPIRTLPSKAQPYLPPSGNGPAIASAAADSLSDPAAQFELAAHYAEDTSSPGKLALAAQWYEKAAQQGHAVAEYRLASLYEKGRGVAKDIERAKELYQRAAERGNIRAMHNLGVLAAEGSDGKPNYTSAALWFSKAAGYGIKDSQYNFAVLLARGLGVIKDLVRSYTWFAIVAATGDADAARKRDEVAARLTSSELSAANAAAAAFVPDTPDRAANEPAPPPAGQDTAKAIPVKSKVSGL
jgi:localization factor PodJL